MSGSRLPTVLSTLYQPLRRLAEWVYPTGCVICGRECGPAVAVCHVCRRRLPFFDFPVCPICGNFARDRLPHRGCITDPPVGPSLVWFAGLLDEGYRPLVHALKYERQLSIGEFFGRRIGRVLAKSFPGRGPTPRVIPVPLHPSRQKQRGYNQSDAIATGLARTTGFPLDHNLLVRIRKTKDQTKLSPKERIANVRGAFKVSRPGSFAGQQVFLVDDVMTTGATLAECIRVISADDADDVQAVVLTLARPISALP